MISEWLLLTFALSGLRASSCLWALLYPGHCSAAWEGWEGQRQGEPVEIIGGLNLSHLPVFHSLPTHVHLLSHAFQGKCCHRTLQPCYKGKRLPDRDGTVIKVPGRGLQIHLTLPQPASGDFRVSELVSPLPIFQFFLKALRLRKPQLS